MAATLKTLKRPKITETELALGLGGDETVKALGEIIQL